MTHFMSDHDALPAFLLDSAPNKNSAGREVGAPD